MMLTLNRDKLDNFPGLNTQKVFKYYGNVVMAIGRFEHFLAFEFIMVSQ